ncbi:MAG: undecaprenyldiphospho-muramoylpentapeptide beta-N-acetylglucosaminyltransferase [Candidatus Hinthialibacter antarcticus]|nr:undecaprenyldiphospho-muramoylpentapeptide beta-N-acetylglucosaminyltransferase [Candidatus Hinthialibacter antarcticus]
MNSTQVGSIVITGGGTGGHLYPALAVAQAVRALAPDAPLLFIGREAERDRREVESRGIPFMGLTLQGLRRKITVSNLKALWLAFSGVVRCLLRMRTMSRGVVFGVGGYASAPALAAGRLLGWKTALHEQNTVPGLVNRILAKSCDAVYVTYEITQQYLTGVNCQVSGFPLRKDMLDAHKNSERNREGAVPAILSMGGSQGARRLVEASLEAFRLLRERGRSFNALLQTGQKNYEWAQSLPSVDGVTLAPYLDDMATAYAKTDIAVSRAGSGSLSELALWATPSVLVPYPYAAENHQAVNAKVFADAGAALVIEEKGLTAKQLADELDTLLNDEELRRGMGQRAADLCKADAAERIARDLIAFLRG